MLSPWIKQKVKLKFLKYVFKEYKMTKAKVKFKPLYENVVVEKESSGERKTDGGIILTEQVQSTDTYEIGTVVAVGEGFKLPDGGVRKLALKVGDRIIYRKNTDFKIDEDGKEYFVLSENSAIGVM